MDKEKKDYIYGSVIVILILIIIFLIGFNSYKQHSHIHEYLPGLWVADENFCNDSGIDGMVLYVGEKQDDGAHNAYLIMYSTGAIIMEKKIALSISEIPSISPFFSDAIEKNLTLQDLSLSSDVSSDNEKREAISALNIDDVSEIHLSKIMPLSMSVEINFTNNCMTWKDEETVYAKLYKDNYSSAF